MNYFISIVLISFIFLLVGASCKPNSAPSSSNLNTPAGQSDSVSDVLPLSKTTETATESDQTTPTTTVTVKPTPALVETKPVTPTPKPVITLKASQLVGGWIVIKAQTSFASITFINDGTYISHLYDRPFDSGKWTLNGATLTLASSAGSEMNKIFTKVSIDGDRLRANDGVIPMIWERGK